MRCRSDFCAPQVWLKSEGFAPPREMLLILSETLPILVSVTVFAELVWPTSVVGKATVDADKRTCVAVPVKFTVCGEPVALSLMARDANRVPDAVGLKVTEIAQLAPAANEVPQVFAGDAEL
jgi:hypothetical protein